MTRPIDHTTIAGKHFPTAEHVPLVVLGAGPAGIAAAVEAALTRALPAGSETILNMLLGTLAAMATSTVSYWVGSSAGSAQKTDMLYRSAPGRDAT